MPSKELQYTRALQKWMREFSAAAVKNNYAELLLRRRPECRVTRQHNRLASQGVVFLPAGKLVLEAAAQRFPERTSQSPQEGLVFEGRVDG
jgi:hypothetical protein